MGQPANLASCLVTQVVLLTVPVRAGLEAEHEHMT